MLIKYIYINICQVFYKYYLFKPQNTQFLIFILKYENFIIKLISIYTALTMRGDKKKEVT